VSSSAYSRERVEVKNSEVRTASAQHPCHRGCPNDTKRISKTRLTTGHLLTIRAVAGCATGSTRPRRCPRAGRASQPLPFSLATGSINSWSDVSNPRLTSSEKRSPHSPERVEVSFCERRVEISEEVRPNGVLRGWDQAHRNLVSRTRVPQPLLRSTVGTKRPWGYSVYKSTVDIAPKGR
jgi:hypothetical protein